MGMDMGAATDRLHGFANWTAILDNRFIFGQFAHRDLVTERNIVQEFHFARGLSFKRQRADESAFFQIHDGDAYIVLGFVQ